MNLSELTAIVHATHDRADAGREFVVRLSAAARKALGVAPGQYVVIESNRRVPGAYSRQQFQVIGAVRDMSPRDSSLPEDERGEDGKITLTHIRLDMTLRDGIGVAEDDRVRMRPLKRSIAVKGFNKWLKYQFVVCRVHKAFSGDMEVPLCRLSPSVIDTLGLDRRGLVTIEAPKGKVNIRAVPLADWQLERNRHKQPISDDMAAQEIGPSADFDKYLELERGRIVPEIHLDLETRKKLEVVPGQPVWVRRDSLVLLRENLGRIGVAIALAVIAAALTLPAWLGTTLAAGAAISLFLLACFELRSGLRA